MNRVLFVATVVKTHIMEFHLPYLKMFHDMGWETAVAARNDYENQEECKIPYCDLFYNVQFERSPFSAGNIKAYKKLKSIINDGQFSIIHCHTPVGGALTRLAAKSARRNDCKVIYTAHGFHFYTGAPILNWVIYYPVERFLAHLTDVLITINSEDYNRARCFAADRVYLVHGVGIDTNKYKKQPEIKKKKLSELGINADDFVILTVGEFTKNKNQKLVLDALALLNNKDKLKNITYLLCGNGEFETELKERACSLGIDEHVRFLGYRDDLDEIYNVADLFVFMSKREGLPAALMEAMSSSLPVLCSKVRGNTDLIENGINGELIDNDACALSDTIIRFEEDPTIRNTYGKEARKSVMQYDLSVVENEMRNIYLGVI